MFYKVSSFIVLAAASIALTFGLAGCSKTTAQTQPAQTDQQGAATDNLAPTDGTQATYANTQEQPVSQAPQQTYQQPAPAQQTSSAPAVEEAAQNQNYSNDEPSAGYQDASYGQPALQAQQPPPPLPEYSQPPIPGNGYLWTPGYWSYAPQGYFWVPGAWAMPPQVGFLWTPGYWGFSAGIYSFNYGFWGPYVGFYGGINYGFGYGGTGYQGGYWSGNRFNYNRSVNNVNITNVNVYNRNINNTNVNRASYNGPGGITRRPLPAETAALRHERIPPMSTQIEHQQAAAQNRQQFASVNHGRPAEFAATKPIAAGRPIAPVIPARTVAQPRQQQQQRAQAQPQQQQQRRAQAEPQQQQAKAQQQHPQQQRAQAEPQQQQAKAQPQQQHPQQQQRAQAQPQQQAKTPPQQRAQAQPQQKAQPQQQERAQAKPQQQHAQQEQRAQAQPQQQHAQQQHVAQARPPASEEKPEEKKK